MRFSVALQYGKGGCGERLPGARKAAIITAEPLNENARFFMCLILFALASHPRFPLIVAANRDERYQRPSRSLQWWPEVSKEAPQLLAGLDLEAGGTWLGITRSGRFAAITNVREGVPRESWQRSRGELTRNFLLGDSSPAAYAALAYAQGEHYAGFNLLVGDGQSFYYCSNRGEAPRRLEPGIYGLSNDSLDTAWPKVVSGKIALRHTLTATTPTADDLLQILADTHVPDDAELPDTGVGAEIERLLATSFIASADYGTRASTALLIDSVGTVDIVEQNFLSGGVRGERLGYRWQIQPNMESSNP